MISPYARLDAGDSRTLGIVLKIAERCNLACTYCYFFFGGDESYRLHSPVMSPASLEDVAQFLEQAVRDYDLDYLEIALHGGEPLLMKKPAFVQLCQRLQACAGDTCELLLAMQTNGVLIDDGWIDIFADNNVSVGVSIDGPRAKHDAFRVDKKGRGSFDNSVRGWRKLKAAAAAGRMPEPGVLCVLTPDMPEDIFGFFTDELDVRQLDFLLPDVSHDTCDYSAADIAVIEARLKSIFDDWQARSDPALRVRYIREAMMPFISEAGKARSLAIRENLFRYMTISSDGQIYVEDTLKSVLADTPADLDVRRSSLADVFGSAPWRIIARGVDTIPQKCAACRYWAVCKGGPMMTRHSRARGFDNPSVYCDALYGFYAHLEQKIAGTGRLRPGFAAPDCIAAAPTEAVA